MAEDTNLYRYTSNKRDSDTTGEVIVGVDEDGNQKAVKLGEVVELTDAEVANARQSFNFTKLSDEQAQKLEADEAPAPKGKSRRGSAADPGGGVVDPSEGGSASETGDAGAAPADDGQGSAGATGQDVGTTTGGTR